MIQTALSIVQSVRKRENLPAITTLVSVTDPDVLQVIEELYAVCEELRQARCFPLQKRKYTFDTVASQRRYQFPADFYAMLLSTAWNDDQSLRLEGPLTDNEMTYRVSGASSGSFFAFRAFGFDQNVNSTGNGQLELDPTPSSAITLSFEYISRNLFIPRNWVTSTVFAATSYCNASGNIYYTTAGGTTGATIPSHTSGSVSDGGVTWAYYSSPYEAIIADTDLCIFDADLVKLGLRAKLREDKGGDYQAAEAEFRAKIDQAVSRQTGSYVGSLIPRMLRPRYIVPPGSWSI